MAVYTNVLGFFAGNSRPYIATFPNTTASAFIKAVVRDIKAYSKDEDIAPLPSGILQMKRGSRNRVITTVETMYPLSIFTAGMISPSVET
jgi:hypothetical protein